MFDAKKLDAQQGTKMTCPYCGKTMTVKYTFTDAVSDPELWYGRTKILKYLSPFQLIIFAAVIIALIIAGMMFR
jgi:hypothetical protein